MQIPTDLLIIMSIRMVVLFSFSIILLIQWYKSIDRSYKDFKFLFGIQFFAMLVSKIFDMILYQTVGSLENLQTEPAYLYLTKLRWTLMIATIIPVFSMMIFIWLNKDKRKQLIFNVSFIVVSLILILIAPNFSFLQMLTTFMILPLMILAIFTFLTLHKHKRLPKFNSLLMASAYFLYTISQILRPFLMGVEEKLTWINELIETITWLMMGLSFFIKPTYSVSKTQEILI